VRQHSSQGGGGGRGAPRGFENFIKRKGGGDKPKANPTKGAEAEAKPKPATPAGGDAGGGAGASTSKAPPASRAQPSSRKEGSSSSSSSAKSASSSTGGGGGGGKSRSGGDGGGGGGAFPDGPNARRLGWLLVGAGGLSMLMSLGPGSGNDGGGGGVGRSREITFVEFCSELVESGQVEKVVISNHSRANVYIRGEGAEEGELRYHFTIGSVDAFERRLDQVQRQLQIDTFDYIPVRAAASPLPAGRPLRAMHAMYAGALGRTGSPCPCGGACSACGGCG
jgi:AFG3 family protein